MPLISVILVTYNREQFLPVILNSLRSQTFNDYELILVNNGATDGTAKICTAYGETDERVKVLTIPENIGASHGRNVGLDAARGEYIAFMDDDDRCEPSMLSFLASLAQEEKADIAMCGSYNEFVEHSYGEKAPVLEPYFIFDERFVFDRIEGLRELLNRKLYNVAPPTKLFRRNLWDGLSFPNNVMVDDIHVVYKAFERAQRVAVQGVPLYYFRKHSANMTAFIHNRRMSPALLDEYLEMYQTRADYLRLRAPELREDIEKSMDAFMESMCSNIFSNGVEGFEKHLNFMKEHLQRNK